MKPTRRQFLHRSAAFPASWMAFAAGLNAKRTASAANGGRSEEALWQLVRRQFPLEERLIYLNAANVCPASRPVLDRYAALLAKAFAGFSDPADAVAAIFKAEARILSESDFRNGCPVASVTLDVASTVEELRVPCAEAFDLWIGTIAQGLGATGLAAKEAKALASYVLASLEGAIVLSRAEKRVGPLERTATFVVQTVRTKLSQR